MCFKGGGQLPPCERPATPSPGPSPYNGRKPAGGSQVVGMFLLLSPAAEGNPCYLVLLFLSLWTQPRVMARAAGQEPAWWTCAF